VPAYAFTARSSRGETRRGQRHGANETALAEELAREGLFLIAAEPARPRPSRRRRLRLGTADLAAFLLHLATYLEAGVPLLTALGDFRDPHQPRLTRAAEDMAARIAEGTPFSRVMEAYPELFQPVHVGMVRAGEAAGRLDPALRQVIRLLEWNASLGAQVRQAATYPLLMLGLLLAVGLLVSSTTLPHIMDLLEELNVDLPAVTRVFLALGHALKAYGWVPPGAAAALWLALPPLLRRPAWRRRWDTAVLALPLAGPLESRLALSRFARSLAAQYASGIPLADALRGCEQVTGNARLGQAVAAIRIGVEQGQRLSACAARSGRFPPLALRLLAIGEETGRLEEALERLAAHCDAQVAAGTRVFFQVLEPAIKVALAGLVLFVALAIMLPIYTLIGGIHGAA